MSTRELSICLDAGPATTAMLALYGRESEFVAAWQSERAAGVRVPFEVALHLYAYEFVERTRECAAAAETRELQAPFWPEALFIAGEVHTHAAPELFALCPPMRIAFRRARPAAVEAEAVRVFACLPFDPERYVAALHDAADRAGWRQR